MTDDVITGRQELLKVQCGFKLDHYLEILNLFKKQGYKDLFFTDEPCENERSLWLRHDIDICPNAMIQMAELEHLNGFRATYFLMLSSPFYNIFDPSTRSLIQKLSALGHAIGLHFDERVCRTDGDIQDMLRWEISVLCRLAGRDVRVVSFHRPSPSLFGVDLPFDHLISTYSPRFTSDGIYFSDSGRRWKRECICGLLRADDVPSKIQLLIHPIWWNKAEMQLNSRLHTFLRDRIGFLDKALASNIRSYSGIVEGKGMTRQRGGKAL